MKLILSTPPHAFLIVKKGDKVKIGDPIMQLHTLSHLKINLAHELGCKNVEIIKYLQKTITEAVAVGDLIAKKPKSWFFGRSRKFFAPVSGMIESISHETGEIVISHYTPDAELISADFEGKIIAFDSKESSLEIELPKVSKRLKTVSVNGEGGGKLLPYQDTLPNAIDAIATSIFYFCEKLTPLMIAQMDTIGVTGCIFVHSDSLPQNMIYACVDKEDFDKIKSQKFSNVYVIATSKEVIIYN